MKAHKSQPVRLFLLCYLAVCTLAVGPLGIEWSRDLATRPNLGFMVWNSILEFNEPLTDQNMPNDKLVGLAKMAWREMNNDHRDNKPWRNDQISNRQAGGAPTIMAAFVRENKVYLSSSVRSCRGRQMGFAYNTILAPPPVQLALYQCILASGGDTHQSGGNCAEQMAAVIVFNEITDGTQKLEGSRVCSSSSPILDARSSSLTNRRQFLGSILRTVARLLTPVGRYQQTTGR
ncbi:MAG: hypothetical protein Q9164_005543 [Protoblastenia rupestris]